MGKTKIKDIDEEYKIYGLQWQCETHTELAVQIILTIIGLICLVSSVTVHTADIINVLLFLSGWAFFGVAFFCSALIPNRYKVGRGIKIITENSDFGGHVVETTEYLFTKDDAYDRKKIEDIVNKHVDTVTKIKRKRDEGRKERENIENEYSIRVPNMNGSKKVG